MQQMGHDKKENNVKNRYRTKQINLPLCIKNGILGYLLQTEA